MSLTVAVDFDGVLHQYSRGWKGGEIYDPPTEGAMKSLVSLLKRFNVAVFTTRDDLKAVSMWLSKELDKHLSGNSDTDMTVFDGRGHKDGRWDVAMSTASRSDNGDKETTKLYVTNKKPIAFVYIDDRAIRFTNWVDVLKYLM